MRYTSAVFLANAAFALGYSHHQSAGSVWSSKQLTNFVAFGDSYTDEGRLSYFGSHGGSGPPPGTDLGVSFNSATGGRTWARYAATYNNARLYNYAVSGAVCSNDLSPRTWSTINAPFPDIKNYELPAFITDSKYVSPNGSKFFTGTADNTVYAIWIGTNDLGNYAFLSDEQKPGATLKDFVDCVYNTVDGLYKNGGRYFVLLNVGPLNLLPQYAVPSAGGLANTKFWPDKPSNATEISYRILEELTLVNQIYDYRTPYETEIAHLYPGAHIANYDVHSLMTNIYNHPASYLNGTAPLNVTGYVSHCDFSFGNCVNNPNPDSFEWFDELHPTEQTSRVIAKEFLNVLNGNSSYAKYYSS